MKNFKKMLVFVSIFSLAMSLASAASASDPKPSGTVTVETTAVAAGVGFQWGEGVLKYEGKEYKFKVKGFSVVDVGISSVSATGDVYHLYDVTNFSGTYSAAGASIALGAGAGYIAMENQNGVIMKVKSTKAGVQLKLAPEGIKVQIVED